MNVLSSYLVGTVAIAAMCLLWVGVQNAWRATFTDVRVGSDVLEGRPRCGDCTSTGPCESRRREED